MSWVPVPIWHGTISEATALNIAISHNCACQELKERCGAHLAMLDQRFIDGVLWMRWMRERLEDEEGVPDAHCNRG